MRRPVVLLCAAALVAGAAALPTGTASARPAAAGSGQSGPHAVVDELLVGYVQGAAPADRERARGRSQAALADRVVRGERGRGEVELVRLPQGRDRRAAIAALESDPAVAYAEPNWIYTTQVTSADPYFTDSRLWGVYGDASSPANQYGSQAAEAWAAGRTGSRSVYVGVIDEGIQSSHPDLDANVWLNPYDHADGVDNDGNGYVDDIRGWDFANGDNSIYDGGKRGSLDKHGTHVAGTIGAESNDAGVVGVNWNVTLISGKFLGRSGGTTANAIKAVDYFTDLKTRHGLNVVATNNSWGGGGFSQGLRDAINRGGNAGILFIAAAGNGGSDGVGDDNDFLADYPSNYKCVTATRQDDCVVAVAAITSSGAKSSFSNFGATTVDLGAPGSGIWSTVPNGYDTYSGTSMATPHVTGGAALYASTHPGATAAAIKTALLSSTVPTASLAGKTVTGGRLDVSGF